MSTESVMNFVIIFFIIGFIIPIILVVFVIRYIVKKSRSEQPIHVLEKERLELISKTRPNKNRLEEWKDEYLEDISNIMDFKFSKGFTRKLSGNIFTFDNKRIISFSKIDRGAMNLTSRIFAITTNHEIYFNQSGNEITIEFNGKYLGKIINNNELFDDSNKVFGTINRNQNSEPFYLVNINKSDVAYIVKNSDRRTFTKNPFYKFHAHHFYEREPVWENNVDYSLLMKLYRATENEYEYNWILSLTILEAIYYSINFSK